MYCSVLKAAGLLAHPFPGSLFCSKIASLAIAAGLAIGGLDASNVEAAVIAPYSDNFNSYTNGATPANFSTVFDNTGGQTWDVQSSAYRYSLNVILDGVRVSGTAVEVGNLGSIGNNFTISSTLKLDSIAFSGSGGNRPAYVGLGALGATAAAFSSGGATPTDLYWGGFKIGASGSQVPVGRLALIGSGQSAFSAGTIPVNTTDTYEMVLSGTYVGSALQLDYTVTNQSTLASVSVSFTDATPLTGQFFGYRTFAQPRQSANIVANFDNFSIVPEPNSLVMLLFGSVMLWLTGRRNDLRRL